MIKCFYHSADLDGKCSAAIVNLAYPNAEMFPINYDKVNHFPWDSIAPDDTVFMLDFSLPKEMMIRLRGCCQKFIWIDHHKTAIESVGETTPEGWWYEGRRVVGDAGCELTWGYLMHLLPDRCDYNLVHLLGRYDVWDKEHKDWRTMLELQSGMRLHDCDPKSNLWLNLLRDNGALSEIIREGAVALKYREMTDASYAKAMAFPVKFEGLRCIAINRAQCSSQSFESVYNPAEHDAMIAFSYNGNRWLVSMYSDKLEVDCGAICKKHGGGGHKGAAGFDSAETPIGDSE